MERVEYKVLDISGKEKGTMALSKGLFGADVDPVAIHGMVRWQLAKRRAGTHATITKGEMKASGKKPWRQKGTGRARAGTSASPLWVGGAVAHGPQPRSYEYRMNKKERKAALVVALSEKVAKSALIVLDNLAVPTGKTKDLAAILETLKVDGKKTLLVLSKSSKEGEQIRRAGKNIPGLMICGVEGVNVYDLMRNRYLIGTREAMTELQEKFGN